MAPDIIHRPQMHQSKVWEALASLLPSQGSDCDYWWKLTGRHLASMVDAAGYSTERQYEALLFHYHWMVPFMGPEPGTGGTLKWPTVLTVEGLPIEYSWKWNTATAMPMIRYTIEAKGKFTGTALDPLNQDASRELLYQLQRVLPNVDLTWTNHFLSTLFDHDRAKYVREAEAGTRHTTTVMIAVELDPEGLSTKTYFIPKRLGLSLAQLPISSLKEAMEEVGPARASRALHEFLSSPEGTLLKPTMVAVDNVNPAAARLKFYLQSPSTSFSSVRNVMTLGGRIPVGEEQMQDLRSLIAAAAGLDNGFPDDTDLPVAVQFNPPTMTARQEETLVLPGFGYYFNIAPGQQYPEVKIFLRLCAYGSDDLSTGRGITGWMSTQGRTEYCEQYMTMLGTLLEHRQLEEGKGVHTHVSCLFKKNGELDVTSYLVPEISAQPGMLQK